MKESKEGKKEIGGRLVSGMALAVVLTALYFVDLEVNMWTFHFVHGNIFHLMGNLIALSYLYKRFNWRLLPAAYLAGSLVWILTPDAVGASAIIFFMWGSTLPVDFTRLNRKQRLMYSTGIIASLSFALFLPNVSFILHLFPFLIGIAIGGIEEEIRKVRAIINDIE